MNDNEKSASFKKTPTLPTGIQSCPLVLQIYSNASYKSRHFPNSSLLSLDKYHVWASNSPSHAKTIPFSSFLQHQCWPDSTAFLSPSGSLPKPATKCLKSDIETPPKNKQYYTEKASLIQELWKRYFFKGRKGFWGSTTQAPLPTSLTLTQGDLLAVLCIQTLVFGNPSHLLCLTRRAIAQEGTQEPPSSNKENHLNFWNHSSIPALTLLIRTI